MLGDGDRGDRSEVTVHSLQASRPWRCCRPARPSGRAQALGSGPQGTRPWHRSGGHSSRVWQGRELLRSHGCRCVPAVAGLPSGPVAAIRQRTSASGPCSVPSLPRCHLTPKFTPVVSRLPSRASGPPWHGVFMLRAGVPSIHAQSQPLARSQLDPAGACPQRPVGGAVPGTWPAGTG